MEHGAAPSQSRLRPSLQINYTHSVAVWLIVVHLKIASACCCCFGRGDLHTNTSFMILSNEQYLRGEWNLVNTAGGWSLYTWYTFSEYSSLFTCKCHMSLTTQTQLIKTCMNLVFGCKLKKSHKCLTKILASLDTFVNHNSSNWTEHVSSKTPADDIVLLLSQTQLSPSVEGPSTFTLLLCMILLCFTELMASTFRGEDGKSM